MQLIHVKGHHDQPGNERADRLAHAGKDRKPYSRIAATCTTDPTPWVPQERVHAHKVLSARETHAAQAKERKSRGLASQTLGGRRRQTVTSGPSPRTTSLNAVRRTAVHGLGPSTPSAGRSVISTDEGMHLITIPTQDPRGYAQLGGTPAIAAPPPQTNHGGTLEQGGELGVQQNTNTKQLGTTSAEGMDPAGNGVPLQTMRPVGAHIADDAVNVCDVVAHTRWTVSTTTSVRRTSRTSFSSKGGSDLTFGV